jgi:hypothetical protein
MNLKKAMFMLMLSLFSIALTAQNFNLSGQVLLNDQLPSGDHSGVLIRFINANTLTIRDSVFSDTQGNYSKSLPAGLYNIQWEKTGYLPQRVNTFALSADITLNTRTLLPGDIIPVSGNVSGTWPAGNVYIVTDDITIPQNQSLTIEQGVQVRFSTGKKNDSEWGINRSGNGQ